MPNVLSIFSGGGGIDCGFKKAGFDICLSTDFWKPACDTLEKNKVGKLVVCDDIRKINYAGELSKIGLTVSDIDVLVGGPPCPAYSKSRFYRTDMARALDDKNSFTLHEYFRTLEEIRPKVFLFENVFGFIYKPHKPAFDLLTQKADELGYEISYRVVNTANYGIPQTQERFFCVGVKKGHGLPFIFPAETHYDPAKYVKSSQGFRLQQTSNNVQVMKLWLSQAGIILGDWKINEAALKELLGIESSDISLFKELSPEQFYFLLALCNTDSDAPLVATDIRNLASASYNIDFDEKAFANRVIKPLHKKALIIAKKTTDGRGAKPYMVELTERTRQEVVRPLLTQFRNQVGNALADAYCKTFSELRSEIDSENTYVKGLALEAFAIKVMKIIGLDFIRTRYRDIQIGGAEVDVLFDSTRLLYSRWQVQCKNTATVTIDMVAKEVGLSHMLKSNAIVMMTTGHLTGEAKKYARRIMEDMNLCVLMLEKEDIACIIANPPSIVDIFNRQSEEVKKIKLLHDGEN